MKTNREETRRDGDEIIMMFLLSFLRVDPWQCGKDEDGVCYSWLLLLLARPLAWLSAYNCNLMA